MCWRYIGLSIFNLHIQNLNFESSSNLEELFSINFLQLETVIKCTYFCGLGMYLSVCVTTKTYINVGSGILVHIFCTCSHKQTQKNASKAQFFIFFYRSAVFEADQYVVSNSVDHSINSKIEISKKKFPSFSRDLIFITQHFMQVGA